MEYVALGLMREFGAIGRYSHNSFIVEASSEEEALRLAYSGEQWDFRGAPLVAPFVRVSE